MPRRHGTNRPEFQAQWPRFHSDRHWARPAGIPEQGDAPPKSTRYINVTLREGFLYGFGVAHLDWAASGLTPSSATSRTPRH
jgi:hypothetical protein